MDALAIKGNVQMNSVYHLTDHVVRDLDLDLL